MSDRTQEGIVPSRQQIPVSPGAFVSHRGSVYRIAQPLDFQSVMGVDVESGRSKALAIAELAPVVGDSVKVPADLAELSDSDWAEAQRRYSAIKPLVDCYTAGRDEAERCAADAGVHVATIYRWLRTYRATGEVLSLVSDKRGWKKGRGRIDPAAEKVVEEVLQDFYLTPQRPTGQQTIREVRRRCLEKEIPAPGASAIRQRINRLPEWDRLRGRGYRERAKNRFLPAAGHFPGADYPLAVIQIDHTPLDIVLVDDVHRRPIGRPWLTLACDVFSRMVTGYHISFDAPSEASVALCMAQSILPKDDWLLLHKVEAEWPVWGVPGKVHVDNGSDFRSDTFKRSCLAYGIDLEFRAAGQPRYGGHIERLLGTLLKEVHGLPGTTFSSIKDKEGYDPEKHAALTKSEFEEWFVAMVCNVYHERVHKGLGVTPRKMWEIGIFGNAEREGVGVPGIPSDRHTVLLDFLPLFERTIQTTGVTIDGMTYYAESLRPWIGAADPDKRGAKRTFIFRRDPRDISTIWFKDPKLEQYFKVPFADQSLPSMSVWELRAAKKWLRDAGGGPVSDAGVLRALTALRADVESAKKKTKKARRTAQRRVDHAKKVSPAAPILKSEPTPKPDGFIEESDDQFGDVIRGFEDFE